MSYVCVYHSSNPLQPVKLLNHEEDIASVLAEIGVGFERLQADKPVTEHSTDTEVKAAYQQEVEQVSQAAGYTAIDVFNIGEQEPDKEQIRAELLQEHWHNEDEACFFVAGRGLLNLHVQEQVFAVFCERGDLVTVPAQMRRWFDIGEQPRVAFIRMFKSPAGRHMHYSGSDVARQYTLLTD